jgi:hypothetical protein
LRPWLPPVYGFPSEWPFTHSWKVWKHRLHVLLFVA